MIHIKKSQPAPECLIREQAKASGDYKCGDVLERIKQDFYNKCYICGYADPPSINVEHFRPHRGDTNLKFSWDNLFWACAHCNNIKLDAYDDMLNCTDSHQNIESRLKYEFKPFPFEKVCIHALDDTSQTLTTKQLLEAVFNGTTTLKTIEAANIRNALLKEVMKFQENLVDYFKVTNDADDKDALQRKIKNQLHPGSNFAPFKRWIIRENPELMAEFGRYTALDDNPQIFEAPIPQ
jgi:hypothetical protein